MDRPSKVAVPRPISSRMTSARGPAWFRMAAVSTISTMKVDRPWARSSEAPTRLNSRSTTPMWAASAGTNEPICASTAISAFWRRNVDLPAMLGPVTSHSRLSPDRSQSLATNGPASSRARAASTTGWRPPVMAKVVVSSTTGRHQRPSPASTARAAITSRSASAAAASEMPCQASATVPTSWSNRLCSSASARSAASEMRPASLASSVVVKRTELASVWRWMKVSASGGRISASAFRAVTSTW